jgi:hypothetical protein
MAEEFNDLGVHDCGHAVEAHGSGGCALCECGATLDRATEEAGTDATVAAPIAEAAGAGELPG